MSFILRTAVCSVAFLLPLVAVADDMAPLVPLDNNTLDAVVDMTMPFTPLTPEQLAEGQELSETWETENQCREAQASCELCEYELSMWCRPRVGFKWKPHEKVQVLYKYCIKCQTTPMIPVILTRYWLQSVTDAQSGANKGWYKECYLGWEYIGPCKRWWPDF